MNDTAPTFVGAAKARGALTRDRRRTVIFAFAIALVLVVAYVVRGALLIIYVSAVFAIVLKPAVDWLHKKSIFGWKPGRGSALLLLVLVLCVFLGGLLAIALPSLFANTASFANSMSRQVAQLQQRLHSIPLLRNVNLSQFNSQFSTALEKLLPALGGATTAILTGILLTAYLILDGSALLKRVLLFFPPEPRPRLADTLNRAAARMRHWLAGQVLLMAILGASAGVTFGIMGLPYFYLLAIFAGAANIVPLLGPLATVIVASVVAATQSGWDVLGVVIFYLVYQQVENAFLTPKIMKSQVELPSAVVIIALLLGSGLAGIAGALVAVPSAVLIAELAGEYLLYQPPPAESKD